MLIEKRRAGRKDRRKSQEQPPDDGSERLRDKGREHGDHTPNEEASEMLIPLDLTQGG